jgi:diguanylate cyclase (GGDEF)-like protein
MKFKGLVFCLLAQLVLTNCAFASENYDESLSRIEKLLQTDFTQAESAIVDIERSLDKLSHPQLAEFYTLLSAKYVYLSELEQANQSLDLALTYSPSEESLTRIYLYKTTVFLMLKNYEAAFAMLEINLARIEGVEDTSLKVASYVRLLNILLDLNAYEEMLSTAQLVLNLNQGKDTKHECYTKVYLAVATLRLGLYSEANDLFKQSEMYCASNEQPLIEVMSIKGQAESYFESGQLDLAKPLFEAALEGYLPFQFQVEIHSVKAFLSKIYFYQGDYQKAALYANEINGLNEDKSNNHVKKQANEVLAMLASRDGEYAKAYQYQVVAHALDLQDLDESNHKQNAYQMARFDSAEKNRENKNLLQERELMVQQKDLFLKEKSSSIMFSTLLFGVCIGLLLLLLTAWLQRNQFMRQSQRDGLTGIFNRQTGQDLAENELVQALSNHRHFSVLVLDLDLFKSINDRFGHATGDWTLKKVTQVIEDVIRPSDIFCRLGGEEFVLYLPNTDEKTAFKLAESIRKEVEHINTKYSGHNFSITLSVGVSSLTGDDLSIDPLLSRADIALYKCKHQGRNKVLVYHPSFA